MRFTRRDALRMAAAAASTAQFGRAEGAPAIAPGPFAGTRESLKSYRIPEWYRDAKFGIWAHWGPQSAAEYGDWYARGMYLEGEWQYKHHVQTYGHPSKFGFKDVIQTWKADKFDPDYLVGLYKQAGAKYFVSMRSEEHTSELQSPCNLVCRLLLEKKKKKKNIKLRLQCH